MSKKGSTIAVDPYLSRAQNKLKVKDKDKFKNIQAINANIGSLYRTIGAPLVPNFKNDLVIDNSCYHGDTATSTRNIAKQIANFLGLPQIRVMVTFAQNLGAPGRVQLSPGDTFFIEIDQKYMYSINLVAGILAHEIAHIYLFKHNLRRENTFENEVLTDTTAAFLGCAGLVLNSSYEETSYSNDQTDVRWFGYITQYEFGYISAKREFLLKQESSAAMMYGRSREFFDDGKSHFLKSLGRPYVKRSALGNLAYRLKSRLRTGSMVFSCLCCEQQLRIPESGKTLSVHCPTCGNNLICYS